MCCHHFSKVLDFEQQLRVQERQKNRNGFEMGRIFGCHDTVSSRVDRTHQVVFVSKTGAVKIAEVAVY